MNPSLPLHRVRIAPSRRLTACKTSHPAWITAVAGALLACAAASGQVITIDTHGNPVSQSGQYVDRRFAQVDPTHVELSKTELDTKTRLELIRFLESDQGFAMRPLPRGHKGLTLEANGKLEPAGEAYLNMVTDQGLSAKPGERVVITNIKFEKSRVSFMLNGGPDAKHRFLQHIELGTGPMMNPVVQNTGDQATGSRITLIFKGRVPQMTGKQVEALLAPLISFEVKTPIQAFTDTLPPKLKSAILEHNVLVGMSTDMVLFAKGQPVRKIREMDGQMPFEEWVYGKPPEDVEFVRINGNRVIRVELAKIGKPPQIFDKDEVEGLMRTDGTPVEAANTNTRTIQMGDVQRNPDTQAPAAPPSLREPGEKTSVDSGNTGQSNGRIGVMKPVQFPKQAPDDHPVAHQGEKQGGKGQGQSDSSQNSAGGSSQTSGQPAAQVQDSSGSQDTAKPADKPSDEQPAGSTLPAPASQPQ